MATAAPALPCNPEAHVCPLAGPSTGHGSVFGFHLSPTGGRVVYVAEQGAGTSLFSVPAGGGAVHRLTDPGGSIGAVAISPDGSRVVYLARPSIADPESLFSVPIDGPPSTGVRLTDDIGEANTAPPGFRVSSDSRTVVHLTADRRAVRALPIDGSDAGISLTELPFGARADGLEISPDDQWVLVLVQETAVARGLHRVQLRPPDPDSTSRLGPLDLDVTRFLLSPADRAVYLSGRSPTDGEGIYRVPLSGSVGRRVTAELPSGFGLNARGWTVTPDGRRVVYRMSLAQDGTVAHLLSGPTTGPRAAVRLDLQIGVSKLTPFIQVSRDGRTVVYLLTHGLFAVPVDGPASTGVELDLPVQGLVPDTVFALSGDSDRVLYVLKAATDDEEERRLYTVPIGGPASESIRLSGSENVSVPVTAPAGNRVAYQGHRDARVDLFGAPLDGTGQRSRPTAEIEECLVDELLLTPNGQRAVYTARRGPGAPVGLFSSPLAVAVIDPPLGTAG